MPESSQCSTWNLVTKHPNPLHTSTPAHPLSLDFLAPHLPVHLLIITSFPPKETSCSSSSTPTGGSCHPIGGSDHSLTCSQPPAKSCVCAGIRLALMCSTAVSLGLGTGWAHPHTSGSLSCRPQGDRDAPRIGDLMCPPASDNFRQKW